jgi:aminoglycoside phosphotransferase family enzyme/predicted kinase
MDTQTLHKALLNPATYDMQDVEITFKETHISRLYFVGNRVYKVKKPVDFGFLDFTTPEKRLFYCREEVRLNERFCDGIYDGVAEIREQNGCFTIDGPGRTVDYAVVMKLLPEDRMLPRLLAQNDPDLPDRMAALARHIAGRYLQLPAFGPGEEDDHFGVVKNNWHENFVQTEPYIGKTISADSFDLLKRYILDFEDSQEALFHKREAGGWVRDGHGDLHCEHICFIDETIAIYDCIEFNRRFRIADVLADLAFLLMDLEIRGHFDLARVVREHYFKVIDSTDDTDRLLPFYQVYRAYVRGKVESFLSTDPGADRKNRRDAESRAKKYFNQALGYLCREPKLVLTCGLMGTGKTTIARELATALGAELLRSDVIRKELAGLSPDRRRHEAFGEGIYSKEAGLATYDALLKRAMAILQTGRPVIVDASFSDRGQREKFRSLAERAGYPVWTVEVTCDRDIALRRLDHRQQAGGDASDGRAALYDRQAASFDSVVGEPRVIEVNGQDEAAASVDRLLCRFLIP